MQNFSILIEISYCLQEGTRDVDLEVSVIWYEKYQNCYTESDLGLVRRPNNQTLTSGIEITNISPFDLGYAYSSGIDDTPF